MEKQFRAILQKFDSKLWAFHLPIPTDVAREFVDGKGRRVVCSIDTRMEFQCALMPMGEDEWFVNINKKVRDELGLVEGQQVKVTLVPDESKYGMEMPEELAELLIQDDVGRGHFDALTPGKQRNLIYIVQQVKSPHIRMRRALVVVDHLKIHGGVIDFKALNIELKAANQRAKG